MEENNNDDVLVSFNEGLRYLNRTMGISSTALYDLVGQKKIPHYRPFGRNIKFKIPDLKTWVESHRVEAVAENQAETQA